LKREEQVKDAIDIYDISQDTSNLFGSDNKFNTINYAFAKGTEKSTSKETIW